MEFVIRELAIDDWQGYKALRLEMLADTPKAYVESLADALAVDDVGWKARVVGRRAGGGTGGPASVSTSSVRLAAVTGGGELIGSMGGFIDEETGSPLLIGVYVVPRFRGDSFGVTSALLAAMEEWALRHADHLLLDVHEDNLRARAAYVKRGWVETGRVIPYPLDETENEIEMIKQLR